MTLGGWVFMLTSVACVYGLAFWCFRKVLTTRTPDAREHPADERQPAR